MSQLDDDDIAAFILLASWARATYPDAQQHPEMPDPFMTPPPFVPPVLIDRDCVCATCRIYGNTIVPGDIPVDANTTNAGEESLSEETEEPSDQTQHHQEYLHRSFQEDMQSNNLNAHPRNTSQGQVPDTSQMDSRDIASYFFPGATNFIIGGSATFTSTHGFPSQRSFRYSNSYPDPHSNDDPNSSSGPDIFIGTDWPFGPNNNPFPHGNEPTTTTAWQRFQSSSSMSPSTITFPNYFHGDNDDDGMSSRESTSDDNPFSPYGGDRFGNGASDFTLSNSSFMTVQGNTFHGVLRPERR